MVEGTTRRVGAIDRMNVVAIKGETIMALICYAS